MNETKTTTVTKKKTVKTPRKKANPLEDVMNLIKNNNFKDALTLIEKNDFNKEQINQITACFDRDLYEIFNVVNNKKNIILEKEKKYEEQNKEEEDIYSEINEKITEYINEIKDKNLKNFLKSFKIDDYESDENNVYYKGEDIEQGEVRIELKNNKGFKIIYEEDYTIDEYDAKSNTTISIYDAKKYYNPKNFCKSYKINLEEFQDFIDFSCDRYNFI